MIVLEFVRPSSPYVPGDIAGFDADTAKFYVEKARAAVMIDPLTLERLSDVGETIDSAPGGFPVDFPFADLAHERGYSYADIRNLDSYRAVQKLNLANNKATGAIWRYLKAQAEE